MTTDAKLIQLLRSVMLLASRAETFEGAAHDCLISVCNHLGWPFGCLILHPDQLGNAKPDESWHSSDPGFSNFRLASDKIRLAGGGLLRDEVEKLHQALWCSVVAEEAHFNGVPSKVDIRTVMAVPVRADRKLTAILAWFACDVIPEDAELMGVASDIATLLEQVAEREHAILSLKKQRDTANRYLDVAGVMIMVLDKDGEVNLINRRGCEILGLPESEIIGRNWFDDFIPEDFRRQVQNVFKSVLAGKAGSSKYFENPVLSKKGGRRIITWHNSRLTDQNDNVIGVLTSGEDITDQRRAEDSLRISESRLRAILDTVVDGIITIDDQGLIETSNPAASRIFGYSSDEILGRNIRILMPEPDRSRHDRYIRNYLDTGNAKIIGIGREVEGRHKDGSLFPLYLAIGETRLSDRRFFTGIVRDLTEFKRMQEEVLHTRSLAAIGQMAASVAHEIKNPLAAISGAVQVLQDSIDRHDGRREILQDVLDEINRLDKAVRQLLMFSKQWVADRCFYSLAEIAQQVAAVVGREKASGSIEFELRVHTSSLAWIDPTLVHQLLWNLTLNAVEAMPEGGRVVFEINETPEAVVFAVSDEGPGIRPDAREKVLLPFFTTKTRGTGLGLAIAKKIMDAHRGHLIIDSSPSGGTTVRLDFPHPERANIDTSQS